jgi:hypothetical protein
VKGIFDERSLSTSSITTASAITRESATVSSTRLPIDHEEAVRSSAARGSVGFFGSTAELRRARLSFGTIRDPLIGLEPELEERWEFDQTVPGDEP